MPERLMPCRPCAGTGEFPPTDGDTCSYCGGAGEVPHIRHEPECSVIDEGVCYTPWCRCDCHGDVPQSAPMGELNGHLGSHVWKNGAELVWECADACPHPTHEDHP